MSLTTRYLLAAGFLILVVGSMYLVWFTDHVVRGLLGISILYAVHLFNKKNLVREA
jgi:hypothetical protein